MTDSRSFGAWLQRERERRGVTLRAIADRTKIGAGLFEALERGDVSRWPGGIYRRAFIRSYAEAVGLDRDLVLTNFERLFPPEEMESIRPRPAPASSKAAGEEPAMRLQLAGPREGAAASHLREACLDVAFVLAVGLAGLAAAGPIGFWCAAAVAAVVHHVCGVLGVRFRPARVRPTPRKEPIRARPLATVVAFSDEQTRSTSRRARARRMAATLSAAAIPHASFRRRRAARS